LADAITNNMNIKIFASLDREYQIFDGIVSTRRKVTRTKRFRAMLIRTTTGLFTTGLEFLMFYFAITFRGKGVISIGFFVLLQIYIFRIMDQMWNIGNVFRNFYQSIGESAEMLEILETPHEIIDHTTKQLTVNQGKIEFQDVDFHYVSGKPVFEKLHLHIKPGEKVAIVGES